MHQFPSLRAALAAVVSLLALLAHLLFRTLEPRATLAARVIFLERQLALYVERGQAPRRATNAERVGFVLLAKLSATWRADWIVFRPSTLVRWHRKAFRLFWTWKSKPGRPPIGRELVALIRRMALENPTWGEERIANELGTKLGVRISPRTVAKYLATGKPRRPERDQRWVTFVRNHARQIVTCDFLTSVTIGFRRLYVFAVLEINTRKVLHVNVTAHPTNDWVAQQLRNALPGDHGYRFLIHDRDVLFSERVNQVAAGLGVEVLLTPARAPKANAFIERLFGSLRRECLDFLIPLSEEQLRRIVLEWAEHYNRGRPHSALGPGFPEPSIGLPRAPNELRHRLPPGTRVAAKAVLGGLHHEYRLEDAA